MQSGLKHFFSNPSRLGVTFAFLSAALSSIATVFIVGATKFLPPLFLAGAAGFLGGLAVLAQLYWSGEKLNLKEIRTHWKPAVILVLSRGVIGAALFVYGLALTTAVKGVFFTKIEPYFILCWNWLLFRERIDRNHFLLLTVHIAGAVILSTGGRIDGLASTQLGDLLVISAMALMALSYIYGREVTQILGGRRAVVLTSGVGGGILLLTSLVVSPFDATAVPPRAWWFMLAYVICFHALALTLWFASLKLIKGWLVSSLRALGPLFGAPVAWLILEEKLDTAQMLGGVAVIATSFLLARIEAVGNRKRSEPEAVPGLEQRPR